MKKQKTFNEMRFCAEVIQELISVCMEIKFEKESEIKFNSLEVQNQDSKWTYDTTEEFIADYRRYEGEALIDFNNNDLSVHIQVYPRYTYAVVKAPTRVIIETVYDVFEKNADTSHLPPEEREDIKQEPPKVFIGHGRSSSWRELKDHLQDKHGVQVIAYETGARAGHTIRDVLEDMVNQSSFALIVMTAEDEQEDGTVRARQNVVHEAGLFQGRLGFHKAIMLVENGVEEFSNIHGIQQIKFSTGNIKEIFGEVLATLRREFEYDS